MHINSLILLHSYRNYFLVAAASVIFALLQIHVAYSADCAQCALTIKSHQEQVLVQQQLTELLNKNTAALSKLGPKDFSKKIKIKSNTLVIELKIDTARNYIQAAVEEYNQKGCKLCPVKEQTQ